MQMEHNAFHYINGINGISWQNANLQTIVQNVLCTSINMPSPQLTCLVLSEDFFRMSKKCLC